MTDPLNENKNLKINMKNLIIEAEQTPIDVIIKSLEKQRDEKLAQTDDKNEKEGIKNAFKKKIERAKANDKVIQARKKHDNLVDEYESEKKKAGDDKDKLEKLKEKFEKKITDAKKNLDTALDERRKDWDTKKKDEPLKHKNDEEPKKSGDPEISHKNDKKSDTSKFAKYGGDLDLDDDSILDNKDINKDGKTKEDVNRFFEKAKDHKDIGKCLDDMPWGVVAVAAIFCPPAAIALGGLTLLPGIINTVMLGLGALKETKDAAAEVCDKIAGGVKKAVNKIKGKSGDDSDIIDAQLDDVINSSIGKDGLKPPKEIKVALDETPTGKALEKRENTVKQLEDGKIDEKVAEAETERADIETRKQAELANAKDDKEKEEIENKYKELIAQADEKVEAAKNGETLSTEEVVDKETGKKIKATVHTGPRGGKYYYPKGAPHNDEHKRYVKNESKSFEYYLNMVMESTNA